MVYASVMIPIDNHELSAGLVPIHSGGFAEINRAKFPAQSLDETLERIVRQSVEICRVRYARLLTLGEDDQFTYQAIFAGDPLLWPGCKRGTRVPQSAQTIYRSAVLRETPMMLGGDPHRVPQSIRVALNMAANDCLYLLPLRLEGEPLGVLVLGEDAGVAGARGNLEARLRLAAIMADQAANTIVRARLAANLEQQQEAVVQMMLRLIEERDPYIGRHCLAVTNVGVRLAARLGCSREQIQTIRYAALLHDIGKVSINDAILNKPGPLTDADWQVIRNHPERGAQVLRVHAQMGDVAALIEAHHEWYNGAGYPFGLQGDNIPLGARILAVADAYSAMTDERPYRVPATTDEAAAELKRFAGSQFDPRVVEIFLTLYTTRSAPLI